MGNKYVWILGIFAASLLLSGGLGLWTFMADDRNPKFHTVSVEPSAFRFTGGRLQVQTEVADDVAVDRVRGVLWLGGSRIEQVAMTRSDVGAKGSIYSAEFSVPANIRSTGESVGYTLQLLAVDSIGQESVKEVSFQVLAPGTPPSPPQLLSLD